MALNEQDGRKILYNFLKKGGIPHPNYQRTVDLAKDYTTYTTGEGMDEMLQKFVTRESDELFEQRKKITQHVIKGTVHRINKVMQKVPRSNYKSRVKFENDEKETKLSTIQALLSRFWGGKSLDLYLCERIIELSSTDPNSFIVIEFKPFDNIRETVKPYPFEVPAAEALQYEYKAGILEFLLVGKPVPYVGGNSIPKKVKDLQTAPAGFLEKYTLYLPNETLQVVQLTDKEVSEANLSSLADFEKHEIKDISELAFDTWRFGQRYFAVTAFTPHNAGEVPAFRAGYCHDLFTKRAICLSHYDPAVPILRKSIKANSELDLTMSLAAFPLSIGYVDACDAPMCHAGTNTATGDTCKTCKGTGEKVQTSVQERLTFRRPKDPTQMFDLEKMLVYKSPPVELLKFQDEYVNNLSKRALHEMFNSEIFSRAEIAETATSKSIDLQNVYDTLVSLADHISTAWAYMVRIIAAFADLKDLKEAALEFSKDFKLKTSADFLEELAKANDSGAGAVAVAAIQRELMRVLVNEQEFQRFEAAQRHNPFKGLNQDEISLALNSNFTTQRKKVLYLNLSSILTELEIDFAKRGGFYALTFEEQAEAIDGKVQEIIDDLPQPASLIPSILDN